MLNIECEWKHSAYIETLNNSNYQPLKSNTSEILFAIMFAEHPRKLFGFGCSGLVL